MIVKLLTEHHLEFVSLKEGCRGSSESTHCWKSHALAQLYTINVKNENEPTCNKPNRKHYTEPNL